MKNLDTETQDNMKKTLSNLISCKKKEPDDN
jgi:hypothetical protein